MYALINCTEYRIEETMERSSGGRLQRLPLLPLLVFMLMTTGLDAFQVTPASKAISMNQGTEQVVTIRLVGTKDERVLIYLGDYFIDRRGTVVFEAGPEMNAPSAKGWISPITAAQEVTYFDPAEQGMITRNAPVVELQQGEVKEVSFRVAPPADAQGEYYATLHFRDLTTSTQDDDTPQVAIYFAVAARLSIAIKGSFVPRREGGVLSDAGSIHQGEGATRISTSFENSGNVHLNVTALTYIRRAKDNRVFAELTLTPAGSQPDGSAFILPGGVRDFEGYLRRPLPPGEYVAETVYDYGSYLRPKNRVEFTVERDTNAEFMTFDYEPKELKVVGAPGSTSIRKITVYNMGAEPLELRIDADEGLLRILTPQLIIPEGSSRNVGIMLRVPEDASRTKINLTPSRGSPADLLVLINETGED